MEDQDKMNMEANSFEKDEVDLIELAKVLWNDRKTIIWTVIVFFLFGLFVALFSQKEYKATTTLVPQSNSGATQIGGLSSLASLAGFNLNMNYGSYELSPVLYPQIVNSNSFQLEIMNSKFSFEEIEEDVTLFDYYMNYYKPGLVESLKKYTLGLPGVVLKAIKGEKDYSNNQIESDSDVLRITKDQDDVRKIISKNVTLKINEKEGYLVLESRFHQAWLSAQIAEKAQKLLQEKITGYKIEKASAQLDFINERYSEARNEYDKIQLKLADFIDANSNIISAKAQTEQTRIENDYQLAFRVYSELAMQMEQARIKVKEDTPVFSVIEKVSVPIEKSKPNRSLIIMIWIFLGLVLSIIIVFRRTFSEGIKSHWNKY